MRFSSFFLFLLAFSLQYAFAATPVCPNPTTQSAYNLGGCNAPAPGNFHHTAVGSYSVTLAWNVEPQADGGYRVRAYRSSDNALINTKNTANAATTSIIMDGLQMDESYYFKINSVCTDGNNSESVAQDGPIHTLIAELIVTGHTPSITDLSCTLTAPGVCYFNHTPNVYNTFSVSTSGEERLFEVHPIIDDSQNLKFQTVLDDFNTDYKFKIRCLATNTTVEPNCSSGEYSIRFLKNINGSEAPVATFKYSNEATRGVMQIMTLTSGYTIKCLSPAPGNKPGAQPGIVKVLNTGQQSLTYLVSPNPFAETLDIKLDQFPQNPVNVQLINPSGVAVLKQTFAAGNDQLSLSTVDLQPGLYFLRVETNGALQTAKIFKSE